MVLTTILPFLGISALVICTPGPDTALTIRNSLTGGRRAGVCTAAGVAAGQLVWTVGTSLGIASLLESSRPAFEALRLVGAAYLCVLGVQSLRIAAHRPVPDSPEMVRRAQVQAGRAIRQGLLNNLANPKMAAFFLSLLPQFTEPGEPHLIHSLLLGLLFSVMTFAWLATYALILDRAHRVLNRPQVRRALGAISGIVLLGFGFRVAAEG